MSVDERELIGRANGRGNGLGAPVELLERHGRHSPKRYGPAVSTEVREEGLLQCVQDQRAGTQDARQWMGGTRGDEVAAAGDHPSLRSTEQLVTGEGDRRRSGAERLARRRFSAQPGRGRTVEPWCVGIEQTRAKVSDDRGTERCEVVDRDRLGEPDEAVVRGVHLQQRGDLAVSEQRGAVVVETRPVGGADLDQARAGLLDDLGDSEPAADLDEFTPADDDGPTVGEHGQDQQNRCGAVIDDERIVGADGGGNQPRGVALARTSTAMVEIDLEVPSARRLGDRQRRPAEVGME